METLLTNASPRTLIVDNSPIFLKCLQRFLNVQGFVQVIGTATDGHTALDLARELTPDLILVDLLMPGMDGLETTLALRQQVPQSRVIIMTAMENPSLATYCKARGAHGFVTKHQVINTLASEIRQLFPSP